MARSTDVDARVEHEPGRFFLRCDGEVAEITYERRGTVLDVRHTWTPPRLRGRDLAARLTAAVFAHAEAEGLRVVPTCAYTRAYVDRHPELHPLLATDPR